MTAKKALISIVTVTFNAEKYIDQCIASVKNQSYPNIEHIIIDGGSTDETIAKLEKSNVKFWISEPDKGIYDAMNKSIKYTNGDWILFLGADDTLFAGFSELCELLLDKNTIYYGQSLLNEKILGGEFDAYRLAKFNICHQCIFYPKAVFQKYQFNLAYKIRADHDLNIRCFADPEFNFKYYPILVSRFAAGGFSSSYDDINFFRDRDQIIKHNFGSYIYFLFKLRKFRHWLKGKKT
jgi:glycosyltransferase involved in cell wall biosynthesis